MFGLCQALFVIDLPFMAGYSALRAFFRTSSLLQEPLEHHAYLLTHNTYEPSEWCVRGHDINFRLLGKAGNGLVAPIGPEP